MPVLKVQDITYEQLQVLVYYTYTGVVVFKDRPNMVKEVADPDMAPFTDVHVDDAESTTPWWSGEIQPADAFEMFRVADQFDVQGLRSAALYHIAAEISAPHLLTDLQEREEIALFPALKKLYRDYCMAKDTLIERNHADIIEFLESFGVFSREEARA